MSNTIPTGWFPHPQPQGIAPYTYSTYTGTSTTVGGTISIQPNIPQTIYLHGCIYDDRGKMVIRLLNYTPQSAYDAIRHAYSEGAVTPERSYLSNKEMITKGYSWRLL